MKCIGILLNIQIYSPVLVIIERIQGNEIFGASSISAMHMSDMRTAYLIQH